MAMGIILCIDCGLPEAECECQFCGNCLHREGEECGFNCGVEIDNDMYCKFWEKEE